ncbi:hypothetical protein RNJ44_00334 [Nakaseomyces bracarensis]|uniref:Thioesterase domain-containing protein n=1 Tax=Nakaseomyces bracarensis TaxID=273131 RepID=A0ABR4NTQ6_9SACH
MNILRNSYRVARPAARTFLGRRLCGQRFASAMPEFTSKKPSGNRWVPITIFGATFGLGWFFTQHMTFTDLMAYWRYDSMPEDSEEIKQYKLQLYQKSDQLPVVKQLTQAGYVEIFPPRRADDLLIDKALSSPGGIAIPPRFYFNPQTKDTVGIYHLGMKLTGYPFIVHGGILATIMEDLMREGVKLITQRTGEKISDLSISYKFPTLANQFVVVRTTKHELLGKKVKLTAEVMDQSGNRTLIKGRGTFST